MLRGDGPNRRDRAGDAGGMVKYLAGLLLVFAVFGTCYGENNLVLYNAGKKDPAAWNILKEYFSSKNYSTLFLQSDGVIERHLERANRVNAIKSGAFVAVEFTFGDEKRVLVAVPETTKDGNGGLRGEPDGQLVWPVEELPARHQAQSRRLAELIAAPFQVKVKKIPLFPLLGIDMPGVLLAVQCKRDEARSVLTALDQALQKYYRRDR